jgi:NADH-quinone oxidoreductase subunit E
VHREFSGIEDAFHNQLVEAARLQANAEVAPSYRSSETDIPVTHPGGDPAGHGGAAFREVAALDLVAIAGSPADDETDEASDDARIEDAQPADEAEAEAVQEVGDRQAGTEGELADQLAGRGREPVPATQDQPPLDPQEGDTPPEAGDDDPEEA